MNITKSSIWLVVALMVSFLVAPITQAADPTTPGLLPYQLTISASLKYAPRTNGKTIVWNDSQRGTTDPNNYDVYGANFSDQKEFSIATGPFNQAGVEIDGDIAVWSESEVCSKCFNQKLLAQNLANRQQYTITQTPDEYVRSWAISGDKVVYEGASHAQDFIKVRDLSTMSSAITLTTDLVGRPVIDGNRVAWIAQTFGSDQSEQWRLYTMQIGDTAPISLDGARLQSTVNPGGLDLHGDILVYAVDYQLKSINLKTGERRTIANRSNGHPAGQTTTDGRYVFWEDYTHTGTNPFGEAALDLWGYDLVTASVFPVVMNNSYNATPNVRNGLLVWSGGQRYGQQSQIFAARVADILPSAPQPAFGSSTDRQYFSQTSHSLSFGFKYFWEHSGSLPVLGFPLTEEYSELNLDTNQIYTVQYFERNRFEYHPENKGTPYETELGRLGWFDALRRGLFDTPAFKQSQTKDTRPDCLFFERTSFNVCGSFLTYWQGHGLEFGDPGTSFREALALFGNPISTEFTDPDSGLTVQYFERARFEYHLQFAGTSNEVELGLLGEQQLQTRGWR